MPACRVYVGLLLSYTLPAGSMPASASCLCLPTSFYDCQLRLGYVSFFRAFVLSVYLVIVPSGYLSIWLSIAKVCGALVCVVYLVYEDVVHPSFYASMVVCEFVCICILLCLVYRLPDLCRPASFYVGPGGL